MVSPTTEDVRGQGRRQVDAEVSVIPGRGVSVEGDCIQTVLMLQRPQGGGRIGVGQRFLEGRHGFSVFAHRFPW